MIIACDYSYAYIFVKATITAINTTTQNQPNNDVKRKVIFKNCTLFNKWINRINNKQVDDAHNIDVVIPMYKLIEYSDIIQKHQEFHDNIAEMNKLYTMIKLLILLKLMLLLIHLKQKKNNT